MICIITTIFICNISYAPPSSRYAFYTVDLSGSLQILRKPYILSSSSLFFFRNQMYRWITCPPALMRRVDQAAERPSNARHFLVELRLKLLEKNTRCNKLHSLANCVLLSMKCHVRVNASPCHSLRVTALHLIKKQFHSQGLKTGLFYYTDIQLYNGTS